MKRMIKNSTDIFGMANMRGMYVKNPHKLPFSFYFSSGMGVSHGPRVKPMFKENKLILSLTGTLKLCDDWEYTPGRDDKNVSASDVQQMKDFFKEYIVLFCAVWDEQMQDSVLEDYLSGRISFEEMIQDLDFYDEFKSSLDNIHGIGILEQFCRNNHLVNMYGN